jgi:cell wall-associated NlpC family hydrolase
MAAGGVLVWSGINNVTITATLTSLLKGTAPTPGPAAQLVSSTGGTTAGTPQTSSALANDALRYVGHPYLYGGYYTDPAGWDCSSFMNYVVGHDGGMPIPGYAAGAYTGTSHGPATGNWLLWNGVTGISQSELQPGDLLVWPTHMGMYIGGGQMVSALDPTDGTKVTTIANGSPTGEPMFCKRLTGLSGVLPTPSGTQAGLIP